METLEISKEYKKGFNHGYSLKQQMPEILEGIKAPANDNHPSDYLEGIKDGEKQFDIDMELGRARGKDVDQSKDVDRDVDMEK